MEDPSSSLVADPLDAEIESLKAEVSALSKRRDVLASVLLSSERVQSMSDEGEVTSHNHYPLEDIRAKHELQTITQNRRAVLNTSFFRTKDADPCAVDGNDVFGLRIERYSHTQRKFLNPAYVFLRKVQASDDQVDESESLWKVHRHTLPTAIPIRALATKFLPEPVPEAQRTTKHVPPTQNLAAFAREITNEVVGLLRRQEAIEAITAPGLKSATAVNAEATEIRLVWNNGTTARMRVTKSGLIEKVVAETKNLPDNALERRLLSAKRLDAVKDKV